MPPDRLRKGRFARNCTACTAAICAERTAQVPSAKHRSEHTASNVLHRMNTGEPMQQLRKQLTYAAGGAWLLWIALSWLQLETLSPYAGAQGWRVIASGLTTILLWMGLAFAAGCVVTHVMIVRDGEMFEVADDENCCANCNCGTDGDQSSSSSS